MYSIYTPVPVLRRNATSVCSHALAASRLPGVFHADPADRFLVATARALNAVLVTADKRIIGYAKQGYLKVGTL